MSIFQLFSVLKARWRIMAGVFAGIVGLGLLVSLLLPKQYVATATVVVDVKPDPVAAILMQNSVSPAYIATQVDVIKSDRVAQRVVKDLKLSDSPQFREQWQAATNGEGRLETWLAETFQKNLEVKPSRESSVVEVSFKAADPRIAAALANAFVQAYVEVSLELKVDPARQYSSFFDLRAKEARERLEAAQAKLSDFQRVNGLVANDERLDVENMRLNELSSQLVALQSLASESSSRQAQINSGASERMQEVLGNPLISSLKSDLTRAEARLQELGSRYGDNHPQVQETRATIAELRSKLDSETKKITGSVGVANSINRQREADVKASIEAQRSKLLKMKALRDEGAVLQRDVESAQRSYEAVQTRLSQTSLESQTTQSNVSVLTQAEPPLKPASPRLTLNALIAVFLGTLLGVTAAVGRELMDRRLRSPEDIGMLGEVPVVGIMPRPNEGRRDALRRKKQMASLQRRIVGALPAAGSST